MAQAGSDRGLVFIVDDDVSFREALEGMVTSFGYGVRAFGSAQAFLGDPGPAGALCLILDVNMAGMDGLELQSELVARGRAAPTIFVSSVEDARIRERALAGGAVAFFSKPFDREALMARISLLAGHSEARAGEGVG